MEFPNFNFKIHVSSKTTEKEKEKEKEVIEVEVLGEYHNAKNRSKRKRKLTSTIWSFFEMLPLGADNKQRCKCKNMELLILQKVNMVLATWKDTLMLVYGEAREIGQLFISQNSCYMMVHANILNQEKIM